MDFKVGQTFIAKFKGKTEKLYNGFVIENGRTYKCCLSNANENGWLWFNIRPADKPDASQLRMSSKILSSFTIPGLLKETSIPYSNRKTFLDNFDIIH